MTTPETELPANPYRAPQGDPNDLALPDDPVLAELLRTRIWAVWAAPLSALTALALVVVGAIGGAERGSSNPLPFLLLLTGGLTMAVLVRGLANRIGRLRAGDVAALEAVIVQQRRLFRACGILAAILTAVVLGAIALAMLFGRGGR
ncbi:MAG TPA: hypothetical protein VN914_15790 [Polyangia bacterium]|nr:hypothetical protein [Polyangia bacterium]